MIMVSRRSILLAETEATYGTDPSPATTDSFLAIDAQIKEVFNAVERPVQQSTLSIQPSLLGERFAELTFKLELKGSGVAGTAPRLGRLLESCGLFETIVPATSVAYSPTSTTNDVKSTTFYLYKDGRLHEINGARGTFKIVCEAGHPAMFEFSFTGLYVAPVIASLISPSYETGDPPVCKNQTFSYNAKTTLIVQTLTLDAANTVIPRPSLSSTDAIAGFMITGRKPMATINPEGQFETSYNFRSDMLATQRAISLTIGTICTLDIAKFNPTNVEYSDRDGITIETLTGECAKNAAAGNDEYTFTFTG